MANEFNIKNGFISNANSLITGNLTVTGGSQTLISGNSSSEMLRVIQVGSGDAFVVEDQANSDPSHFVINASGNTAIGLTQPIGNDKLTVSGNTTIYGDFISSTVSATTITATNYINLPIDLYVTGATYDNNTFTFKNNTGGTFNTSFNTVTGLTVNGNVSISGSSLPNGYALSLTGDTNFVGDMYVSGDTTIGGNLTTSTANISTVPTTNSTDTDVLVRNSSTGYVEKRSINSLTNVVNLITVGLTNSVGVDYNSIKSAVDSITDATSANTYVVSVGPGLYNENPITMKSYVDVIGASETNTIIQANNPNQTLIIGADQSMISNVQIQGCTGTSVAAVVYSSATTPQLNAIFYVENVRFGANYTHAKTVGTGGGNCIMQCSNVKYGGYPFTLGFYVTSDGSSIGRMQLRNVTSTNGGVTTTTGLIFAKADQPNCAFIVNGCLLTKAAGSPAGTGFWVENGGSLRLTAVNFQRWDTGIYAPQTGSAPSIEAIALNFENCNTDVNIIHSGATGKVQGTDTYAKTLININAPLYEVNQDPRIISVDKKGGDFSSLKSAVDSITGSSANNRFLVSVGPGKFTEGLIDLSNKPYVSIEGSNILTTEIVPSGNTQHIIKIGKDNEVSFLSLSGAASGYAGIYAYDIGDYGQAHKVSFVDCDTNLWVESNTIETIFYGEYLDFNGTYTYGVKVVGNNGIKALANVENYYNFPSGTNITFCNYASGSGATLNVFVGDNASNGVSGSTAFLIQDGAQLNTSTITVDGFTYGIRNPNIGLPIRFDVDNASFVDCEWDLFVENPSTFGTFNGSSNHEKLYTASENVYWGFLDINDGEFDITRKISVTFPDGSHTDLSTLVFGGGTMGLISGGTLTNVSGTTIHAAAGFGYLEKSDNSGIVRRIDWVNSQITLSANTNEYLFINENSVLSNSGTIPITINNIVLGRVVTDSTTVRFIDLSPVNADHTSNRYAKFFREALGPVYAVGSVVTENTTPFHIDITAGEYYFSSTEFLPSGGTNLSFIQYYRDGIGGWNTSATTVVNYTHYDGDGSLSALTASAYTKHTLYTVGSGVYEKYFLVLGQNEYSTLVETENALLPTPPSFFSDSVTPIANIYVKQGFSGITQFEDIRPVIGFKAGGVNASSLHANLLGLSADDHTQYLLTNGNRAMSGNLNMGTNNITSVGTINSVDISSHSTRHLPNGTDALATAAPIDVSTSNSIGIANSFSRSDHQHALGTNIINDSNISAHTSTKITITNKSLLNSNIVYSDQINIGVTATTISATTVLSTNVTSNIISGTTISGGTLYGDGSNITNIPIPYGIINAMANFTFLT